MPTRSAARPILFATPMVHAILDGRKTQSRRIIQPQPHEADLDVPILDGKPIRCRYGLAGDRLWVRERWGYLRQFKNRRAAERGPIVYATDTGASGLRGAWRPSRYMPRKVSRIALDIISIRIERLTQISQSDARAEGFDPITDGPDPIAWFRDLWDSITPAEGFRWNDNPWVWVIRFVKA
jgi:hypothetical protein